MQSEIPVWKWIVSAISIMIVCFFIGYFVFAPKSQPITETVGGTATGDGGSTTPGATVLVKPTPQPEAAVVIAEKTQQIEAVKKKIEDDRRKADKAKQEQEEKRKREERLAQEAVEAAAPVTTPDPVPIKTETVPPTGDTPTTDTPVSNPPTGTGQDPIPTPTNDPPKPTDPKPADTPPLGAVGTESDRALPARRDKLYRVLIGTYPDADAAQNKIQELKGRGYGTLLYKTRIGGRDVYRIQLGAYSDEKGARDFQRELQANDYDAVVSRG